MKLFLCAVLVLSSQAKFQINFVNVELQDHLGLRQALGWCLHPQGGVIKVLDTLLGSSHLQPSIVDLLRHQYRDKSGSLGSNISSPTRLFSLSHSLGSAVPQVMSDILAGYDQKSNASELSSRTVSGNRQLSKHQATILEELATHLLPLSISSQLHPHDWTQQSLLSLLNVLDLGSLVLNIPNHSVLRDRVSTLADRLCILQDLENMIPGLLDETPLTCAIRTLIAVFTTCQTSVWDSVAPDCFIAPITGFPKTSCFTPSSILQRAEASSALRVFDWNDSRVSIDLLLQNSVPLPLYITAPTRNAELLTYLTLYRAINIIYDLAKRNLSECPIPYVIPGWKNILILSTTSPHESSNRNLQHQIPHLVLSQKLDNPCYFAAGLRGTLLRGEWYTNYLLHQIPLSLMHHSDATAHFGFSSLVHRILPPVIAVLEDASNDAKCTFSETRVTLYGHSQGASVAQLIALYLADRWGDTPVKIEAVLFAGARQLNAQASEIYRTRVNGRHIIDIADPLFHMPCHSQNSRSGMSRCGRRHFMQSGQGRDVWSDIPGTVLIDSNVSSQIVDFPTYSLSETARTRISKGIEDLLQSASITSNSFKFPALFDLVPDLFSLGFSNLIAPLRTYFPSKEDFRAVHIFSIACVLSTACHGLPWSLFNWWCANLEQSNE